MTTKRRDRLRELETRVIDLDRLVMHINMVLAHIVEQHAPVSGQLVEYSLFALTLRITAAQDDAIIDFLKWAYDEHDADRLTRERLLAEWEKRADQQIRSHLRQIVRIWETDREGDRKVLSKILGIE